MTEREGEPERESKKPRDWRKVHNVYLKRRE